MHDGMPKPVSISVCDHKIRKRREYLRIQRRGTRVFGRFIVVIGQRTIEKGVGRAGITVPKKVGPAYVRNRIKRRIRHILRLEPNLLLNRLIVVVARDNAGKATFTELRGELLKLCRRLNHNRNLELTLQKEYPHKIASRGFHEYTI